jgi:uncharacterized tellurite resistance protein B-like protein
MPALIVAAALIIGVLYWVVRMYRVPLGADGSTHGIEGLRSRTGLRLVEPDLWRLTQIDDARFAAAILMLQIVRTGSPVTCAERARILRFLADPLHVADPVAMLDMAMDYAGARRPFHLTAEAVLPLLRRRLTGEERGALVAMLNAVAGAYSPPSDLQRAAIARFREGLCADPLRRLAGR